MHISQFLEKFKNTGSKDLLIREKIAKLFSEMYHMTISKEHIKLNNAILTVTASPVVKNDIFMKKQQHILWLREKIPGVIITDIR